WDYGQGSIQLGGHELRASSQRELHQLIGAVEQHTHLFNATGRENLLIPRPQASQADIEEATKQACLPAVIQALPQAYDTWIGERGTHYDLLQAEGLYWKLWQIQNQVRAAQL